jgi:hypothetical protein
MTLSSSTKNIPTYKVQVCCWYLVSPSAEELSGVVPFHKEIKEVFYGWTDETDSGIPRKKVEALVPFIKYRYISNFTKSSAV